MKRIGLGLVLAFVLFVVSLSAAVGTATVTTSAVRDATTKYTKYSIAWTSSAGGAVSANLFTVVAGRIVSVRFIPNTGGTQPTTLYDVTLVDTNSVDVLFGAGADLSNSAASVTRINPPYFQDGSRQLDLVVANAGAAKTGVVEFLVQTQ